MLGNWVDSGLYRLMHRLWDRSDEEAIIGSSGSCLGASARLTGSLIHSTKLPVAIAVTNDIAPQDLWMAPGATSIRASQSSIKDLRPDRSRVHGTSVPARSGVTNQMRRFATTEHFGMSFRTRLKGSKLQCCASIVLRRNAPGPASPKYRWI